MVVPPYRPGHRPPALQAWALAHLDDVRIVDGDHFLVFLRPDVVAAVILETFSRNRA